MYFAICNVNINAVCFDSLMGQESKGMLKPARSRPSLGVGLLQLTGELDVRLFIALPLLLLL